MTTGRAQRHLDFHCTTDDVSDDLSMIRFCEQGDVKLSTSHEDKPMRTPEPVSREVTPE